MSSYQAIWTHFKPPFIFFEPKKSDPGLKILILVPKISDSGPKILILVQKNIISWIHKLFLLGGCRPQTPCSSWGSSSPLDPLAGGLQPPVPPYREAPPLGLSVDLGTKPLTCGFVAAAAFLSSEKWAPYFRRPLIWEAPNLGRAHKKSISCGASRVHQA